MACGGLRKRDADPHLTMCLYALSGNSGNLQTLFSRSTIYRFDMGNSLRYIAWTRVIFPLEFTYPDSM